MDWRDQINKWLGEWCRCEGRWRCYWHDLVEDQGYSTVVFQEMFEEDERRTDEMGEAWEAMQRSYEEQESQDP
jgi:hypothetical protein